MIVESNEATGAGTESSENVEVEQGGSEQQAPESAETGSEEKSAKADGNGRPEHVPMGRFREVVGQKNEMKRRLEALTAEVERLRSSGQNQNSAAQQGGEQSAPKRPRPEDFGSREAWEAAMDRYEDERGKYHETAAEKRIREQIERDNGKNTQQARAMEAQSRTIEAFDASFAELSKTNKAAAEALPVFAEMRHDNPQVWWSVVKHKQGATIAVEMANDPVFAEEVLSSDPLEAGLLIAEKLAEIKTRAPKATPSSTRTVGGSGKSTAVLSDSMSDAEWFAARKAQGE